MAERAPELAALQRWFARVVRDPRDVASGLAAAAAHSGESFALEQRVRSGPRLDAAGRLEVYRHGYHARLLDCLVDDYPALQHALGKAEFACLCGEYVVRRPSRSPSLNGFGAHMPGFVREHAGARAVFLSELAALEWAIVEVIHAHDGEPISAAALSGLSPETWATLSLVPSAALRLLESSYPVAEYYEAFRAGAAPELPAPNARHTLVRRRGPQISREIVPARAAELLRALLRSQPLAAALEAAADGGVSSAEVGAWFQQWMGAGLFIGLAARAQ